MRPVISIVVLNYNSSHYTINCIASILKSTYKNYEIIVVDNNSSLSDFDVLNKYITLLNNDMIFIIKNKINFGFALGNIMGIDKSCGDYVFILNNDTLIESDSLEILHSFMESNPDASLSIPAQYDEDGIYHPSFRYIPSVMNQWLGSGFCRLFNKQDYVDRRKIYDHPFLVQMGSGASMFFRTKDYYKVGGLDPNFFLYCEEEDICMRMRKKYMKIYFIPDAKITHFCGGSTTRNIDIEKEFYISLFYLFDKNYTALSALMLKLRFIVKEAIRTIKKPTKDRVRLLASLLTSPSLSCSLRHRQSGVVDNNIL